MSRKARDGGFRDATDNIDDTAGNGVPLPEETKADKFRRLANIRFNNAVKAIEGLTALSSAASYEYSAEQIQLLTASLKEAYDVMCSSFEAGKPPVKKRKGLFS